MPHISKALVLITVLLGLSACSEDVMSKGSSAKIYPESIASNMQAVPLYP